MLIALPVALALVDASLARAAVPTSLVSHHRTRLVSYRGLRLRVPASWPVFRLAAKPSTCVRFNRHAVYLGVPGADESCPRVAIGRTEAILVSPGSTGMLALGSDAARLRERRAHLTVIATWNRHPGTIRRALGVRSLRSYARAAAKEPAPAAAARRFGTARVLGLERALAGGRALLGDRALGSERDALLSPGSPASPGQLFTGLGFDACSAPSPAVMGAWAGSPYGAIGIYIGGANMACAQSNLNAAWVSAESGAGWHLLPLYVGLQAPGNTCGCAAISPASAASEGVGAALDAVANAQALGLGPGNPIFLDMEAYPHLGSVSQTVLAFVASWTSQLHADGYRSGIYSSDSSGISDLVAQLGTPFDEPDELWIANWNGVPDTNDPVVPAGDWVGQRVHQYLGASNQTFGGATINVDQNAVDAATAASGTTAPPPPPVTTPPVASAPPAITGAPLLNQTLTIVSGTWSGSPVAYGYQWEDCIPGGTCNPITGATGTSYRLVATDVGAQIRVVQTATNAGGSSAPAVSPPTARIASAPTAGYWLVTTSGNVVPGPGAKWFGSALHAHVSTITGFATTPSRLGYWLVDAAGEVRSYGNAGPIKSGKYGRAIIGIVAARRGAWLFTAAGNVFNVGGAPTFGSPKGHISSRIVGMAATPDGRGYWLVDSTGRIYAFGDAPALSAGQVPAPVRGIVAERGAGAWIYTTTGLVIGLGGAATFPSPALPAGTRIVGMARTADGHGYWLLDSTGQLHAYGDAPWFWEHPQLHPIIGVFS